MTENPELHEFANRPITLPGTGQGKPEGIPHDVWELAGEMGMTTSHYHPISNHSMYIKDLIARSVMADRKARN